MYQGYFAENPAFALLLSQFLSSVHVFILPFVLLCCRSGAELWLPWSLISALTCHPFVSSTRFHPQPQQNLKMASAIKVFPLRCGTAVAVITTQAVIIFTRRI